MEFNEKLQNLRKSKGLTQEELAELLFVSRTAISKWESGRGYPNIDSIKEIANFFNITIDELLSSNELLIIVKEDTTQKEKHFRDLLFGLLDCSIAMFCFLPFFKQTENGILQATPLLSLNEISLYLKITYITVIAAIVFGGLLTLTLQNLNKTFWVKAKGKLSLTLNVAAVLLFIVSSQPYAATFLFIFLAIKVLTLVKQQ